MEINKVNLTKLPIFDGIEIKSASFVDKHFPIHFHLNWSLAYIEFGTENISFNNSNFLLNKNAVILIPPFSLHKNWGNKNNIWTYKAMYINIDIIKNVAKRLKIDYSYLSSFPYFVNYNSEEIQINSDSIIKQLERLFSNTIYNETFFKTSINSLPNFDEILFYLHFNYNDNITLDSLEKRFKINKFKLLKNFKLKIGLTPLEYQTALRIEKSKQLFFENLSLTHIALESGFYDQSHFSHSFKKYVGVTPGMYKSNCNILQDWK